MANLYLRIRCHMRKLQAVMAMIQTPLQNLQLEALSYCIHQHRQDALIYIYFLDTSPPVLPTNPARLIENPNPLPHPTDSLAFYTTMVPPSASKRPRCVQTTGTRTSPRLQHSRPDEASSPVPPTPHTGASERQLLSESNRTSEELV